MIYRFRSVDHPEADGREAQTGETEWVVKIPLEDKGTLYIEVGRRGRNALKDILDQDTRDLRDAETNSRLAQDTPPMPGDPGAD